MGFKNLDLSKINISSKSQNNLKNEYRGNINFTIKLTEHVVQRFNERHLNNVDGNLSVIKKELLDLIYEKGIIGYGNNSQKFLALPHVGIFIVREMEIVTFIDLKSISSYYRDLYIKLLNKGRIKYIN